MARIILEVMAQERQRRAEQLESWQRRQELFRGVGCTKPKYVFNPNDPPRPPQPSMGPTQGSRLQNAIDTAKRLDYEYTVAELSGDRERMHKILQEMAALLTSDGGHGGGGHGDPHPPEPPDPHAPLREEILRNSRNIAPIVRNLSPQELADLRAAPTPGTGPVRVVIPPTTPRAPRR